MAGIEEDADIGTRERRRELPNLALHRRLVEIEPRDDLDTERFQRRSKVLSIIAGISQRAGVLVVGIPDRKRNALLGEHRRRQRHEKQESNRGPYHRQRPLKPRPHSTRDDGRMPTNPASAWSP